MAATPDLVGTVLRGRYTVVRKLGEGAMGAVYGAVTPAGDRVAVKSIHPDVAAAGIASSAAMARFFEEVRTSSAIDDPHVVRYVDSGVDERTLSPFLVMQMLDGCDVEALVARVGPLDPTTAVRITVQAARGLAAAHAARIVHRDVKPANLFLHAEADGRVIVKVCDFGIAKSLESQGIRLTQTGTAIGTPLFLAPEQAKSAKHVDARADVFSLAASLYCMLAGKAPHETAGSMAELMLWIFTKDAPHVQSVAPWVEPRLAEVVHGALIRDPSARCPSMQAFIDALLPLCGGGEQLTREALVGVTVNPSWTASRAELPMSWTEVASRQKSQRPPDPLLGAVLGGRYRLEKILGRGGMGAVYQATGPGGSCAVKVIVADASADARKRFVREARASAAIASDHVVRVIEADTDPGTGTPFIAMELLVGVDLHELVKQLGAIEPLTVARILLQACEGLARAHEHGIVHRDVKPANLFLHVMPSGDIVVKVCDFGIAKSLTGDALEPTQNQLTRTGGMLGSPIYMSPEQAKNAKNVDARTDVWSLCMSMLEALTGKEPWPGCTTIGELVLAICTEDVPPLARTAPWVDIKLSAIVERGLSRDPARRWSSLREMAAALRPVAGEPPLLTADMLVAVSEERRSLPGMGPISVDDPGNPSARGISATTAGTSRTTASTPRVRTLGVAAAAVLLAGAAAAAYALRPAGTSTQVASAETPVPIETSPTTHVEVLPASSPSVTPDPPSSVRVVVEPPDAKVTIDGRAVTVDETGGVVLRGEPGERFELVAVAGSARAQATIVVLKGGIAEPSHVRVSQQAPSRPQPAAKGTGAAPHPSPPPAAAPTAKPAEAAPAVPKLHSTW